MQRRLRKTKEVRGNYATVDHIDCLAFGGKHELSNIQVICLDCHRLKAQLENEFIIVLEGFGRGRSSCTPANMVTA